MVNHEIVSHYFLPISVTLLAALILITFYNVFTSMNKKPQQQSNSVDPNRPVYTITIEDDPPPKYGKVEVLPPVYKEFEA